MFEIGHAGEEHVEQLIVVPPITDVTRYGQPFEIEVQLNVREFQVGLKHRQGEVREDRTRTKNGFVGVKVDGADLENTQRWCDGPWA